MLTQVLLNDIDLVSVLSSSRRRQLSDEVSERVSALQKTHDSYLSMVAEQEKRLAANQKKLEQHLKNLDATEAAVKEVRMLEQ